MKRRSSLPAFPATPSSSRAGGRLATLSVLAALLSSGCVIGGNKYQRPRDLPDSWLVDRLRVLAVAPEPPEARPGETVRFSALIVDPQAVEPMVVWIACPPDDASGFGCAIDLAALGDDTPTIEELMEAGIIGIDPWLQPVYVPDESLLDGLSEAERAEGVYVTVQVVVVPPSGEEEDGELEDIDFNEVEAAYKRLVVSEASTPNRNPRIASFTVDGTGIPEGGVAMVDASSTVEIGVVIDESSVETYEYTVEDGTIEIREEEPYVTWYTTGGSMGEIWTLYPYTQADWHAPDVSGAAGTWYAVVRDRRGGMAWATQDWVAR